MVGAVFSERYFSLFYFFKLDFLRFKKICIIVDFKIFSISGVSQRMASIDCCFSV